MLNKEQNSSIQNSLLIGPIGFLSSFNLMYLVSLLERLWSFWLLNKQWLIEPCHYFSFNLVNT